MNRDHFFHPLAEKLTARLDRIAATRSDRAQVFRDWLRMITAALTGGREEPMYLEAVRAYADEGKDRGERACDELARMWGEMHEWMKANPFGDLLGDIFQGGITRGEAGQFFTPDALCEAMAALCDNTDETAPGHPEDTGREPLKIADPACGSGRILLAYAKRRPHELYFGTDIDERCVMMTAINMAVNGVVAAVVHGNTLSLDVWGGWLAGNDGTGLLRRLTIDEARHILGAYPSTNAAQNSEPVPAAKPKRTRTVVVDGDDDLAKELGIL